MEGENILKNENDNEIWRKWSKEELDYQYSPSQWSKQGTPTEVIAHHVQWTAEESKKVRDSLECELNISYGMSESQKLDIFGANTLPPGSPIFVFIHGGYWQSMSKDDYSYVAASMTKAGAVTIVMEYTRAPKANMETIVSDVKLGTSYVLNFAKRRESSGVYLCGHSAGGHLVAMLLAVDWLTECMVSPSLIKGAIIMSGIFDLRPLVPTYINDPLKMTEESALKNSPIAVMENSVKLSTKRRIVLAVAEEDPKEFHRQTGEILQILVQAGIQADSVVIPGVDHFGIVEKLGLEDFQVTQMAVEMMNLNIGNIAKQMETTAM
uniref:Kynurenine formamidase-like n=1 Tax=Crassostrea virginica TaxID=6565 RepID=A0A8B8AJ83_CRAVI|nr:kynurenine formamidase-like [Crassostrea virginica]